MNSALRLALMMVVALAAVLGVIRAPLQAQAQVEITISVSDISGPSYVYGFKKRNGLVTRCAYFQSAKVEHT